MLRNKALEILNENLIINNNIPSFVLFIYDSYKDIAKISH